VLVARRAGELFAIDAICARCGAPLTGSSLARVKPQRLPVAAGAPGSVVIVGGGAAAPPPRKRSISRKYVETCNGTLTCRNMPREGHA
jgi:hypothetical protein